MGCERKGVDALLIASGVERPAVQPEPRCERLRRNLTRPSRLFGVCVQGYFVGRKELVGWVQQYFQPNFSKVEDCASGVVYCQIIDSIYSGAVPMSKVKMQAKTEVESIHNFKILQTAFSKKRIDRFIDVDKLTKRSFQTNMEFLQFMKCYWDMHAPNGAMPDGHMNGQPPLAEASAPNTSMPTPEKPAQKPKAAPKAHDDAANKLGGGAKRAAPGARPKAEPSVSGGAGSSEQQRQLALEVTELKMSVENLERERDFYYSKLREVEVLCQAHEADAVPFLQSVLEILYKTDDADEFVTPDDADIAVQ